LRARFARALLGSFQHLETLTWNWGGQNLENLTSKHIKANVFKNDCTCACIQHIVILTSLCKWIRPKWLVFVVKRYAVREAKKWRYTVRNAKIERYAVRKGWGGCHPHNYMDVGQTGGLQKRDSEWAYYLSSLYCICWQYNM